MHFQSSLVVSAVRAVNSVNATLKTVVLEAQACNPCAAFAPPCHRGRASPVRELTRLLLSRSQLTRSVDRSVRTVAESLSFKIGAGRREPLGRAGENWNLFGSYERLHSPRNDSRDLSRKLETDYSLWVVMPTTMIGRHRCAPPARMATNVGFCCTRTGMVGETPHPDFFSPLLVSGSLLLWLQTLPETKLVR